MRVAFLVNAFPVVSETFVLGQIKGAIDRGHDVHVFACDNSNPKMAWTACPIDYLDVPSHWRRRLVEGGKAWWSARHNPALCIRSLNVARYGRMAAGLRLLIASAKLLDLRDTSFHVIHCQFGPLGNIALGLRDIGAWRGAIVTAFRGYDATKLLKHSPRLYDKLFRYGDAFLPVSRALQEELVAHGCPENKIEVLHSGVDCTRLVYRPRTRIAGEPVRLISVARLVEKKGIDVAVRAIARLIEWGHDVQYDVIGDGEQREPLTRLIAELSLHAHVRLRGWQDHAATVAELERSHILIAPSVTAGDGDQEGIPNALKEAMALGMPVVATRHGGNVELVDDGISGWIVPERDVDSLARRVADLLAVPERWPSMGLAGRTKIEQEFDAQRLAAALDDVYVRVVERYRSDNGRAGWLSAVAAER